MAPASLTNLLRRTGRHPQRELVALVHGGSRGTAVSYRDVVKYRARCNPADNAEYGGRGPRW